MEARKAELPKEKLYDFRILQETLDKNRPKNEINEFDREQVYIVASWNDWIPYPMITSFEQKKIKSEGAELEAWCTK